MHCWDFHTHRQGQLHSIFHAGKSILAEGLPVSVGIHPWELDSNWATDFEKIKREVDQNPFVMAIGESGFDRLKGPDIPMQKEAFSAQASMAARLEIPLILHCVKSHDLLLEYLKSAKNPPNIIWHGWNQKTELATKLLPFPVFFSFGKHILHPGSNAEKWLKSCPLDRVFFETDDSGAEIDSIYQAASLLLQLPLPRLPTQVIANWNAISKRKIA
jgi:TatD DNase family protein